MTLLSHPMGARGNETTWEPTGRADRPAPATRPPAPTRAGHRCRRWPIASSRPPCAASPAGAWSRPPSTTSPARPAAAGPPSTGRSPAARTRSCSPRPASARCGGFLDDLVGRARGHRLPRRPAGRGAVAGVRAIRTHEVLQYLLEHEPAVVLPSLTFDGIDPLLTWPPVRRPRARALPAARRSPARPPSGWPASALPTASSARRPRSHRPRRRAPLRRHLPACPASPPTDAPAPPT